MLDPTVGTTGGRTGPDPGPVTDPWADAGRGTGMPYAADRNPILLSGSHDGG